MRCKKSEGVESFVKKIKRNLKKRRKKLATSSFIATDKLRDKTAIGWSFFNHGVAIAIKLNVIDMKKRAWMMSFLFICIHCVVFMTRSQ